MQIVDLNIGDLKPYKENPRINDNAIDAVAASIAEFGFKVPIIVDADNVIIAGHTRLKAAQKLGFKSVPVIRADDLTPEQVKAFRLVDNKTAELAEWDFEKLEAELAELSEMDMSQFGFEEMPDGDRSTLDDEKYTTKTDIPQYEPSGEKWNIPDLYDDSKTTELRDEIQAANLPADIKSFLEAAAARHTVYNYKRIADYYSQAPASVQRLFEKSALVIIDFDDAIKNGYTPLEAEAGRYV